MFTVTRILILALGVAQAGEPTPLLDLTAPEIREMEKSKTTGCGSGGGVYVSGSPFRPPQLTLRLDLERVNQDRFKPGNVVVADVRLTNSGEKAVIIPWDTHRETVYGEGCNGLGIPNPPATLLGTVGLCLLDSQGRGTLVGAHFLYARSDKPATYRVLAPQQAARIRLDAKLDLHHQRVGAAPARGADRFRLIAVFDLSDSTLPNPYQTVTSVNRKEVTIATN